MNPQPISASAPSKVPAYLVVIIGGLLCLGGVASFFGYLGLSLFNRGEDVLGAQLGQMAGLFLGLVGGGLAIYHGLGSILNRPSGPLQLLPIHTFWIAFAMVLGLGNLLLNFRVSETFLFPPVFALGAALPTLSVVAWAARRLGWPMSWRQGALALVSGGTLSIFVAILLETFLPYLAYVLMAPLQFLAYSLGEVTSSGGAGFLERLFFSPLLLLFLITTALAAPIPEELAKALCLPIFGRARLSNERQVMLIGLASGAGFAILENMLYEGLYAQYNGWSWGGVTLLRGIGAVLHPLCTSLVALGWWRMRTKGVGQLLRAYVLAVGLHTLWNGGFEAFVYLTGLEYYAGAGPSLTLYGTAVQALLVVYLVALSLVLWWLLRRKVAGLAQDVIPDLSPTIISSRALAGWALACALVVVPIGAALGGAWSQIIGVMLAGR